MRTIEVRRETAAAGTPDGTSGSALAPAADGLAPPPLEAAWLETVETATVRRAPLDVDAADVLPTPLGET